MDTYTVKKGDTPSSIARALGIPLARFMEANPGLDPYRLQIGSQLKLPGKALPRSERPISEASYFGTIRDKGWTQQSGAALERRIKADPSPNPFVAPRGTFWDDKPRPESAPTSGLMSSAQARPRGFWDNARTMLTGDETPLTPDELHKIESMVSLGSNLIPLGKFGKMFSAARAIPSYKPSVPGVQSPRPANLKEELQGIHQRVKQTSPSPTAYMQKRAASEHPKQRGPKLLTGKELEKRRAYYKQHLPREVQTENPTVVRASEVGMTPNNWANVIRQADRKKPVIIDGASDLGFASDRVIIVGGKGGLKKFDPEKVLDSTDAPIVTQAMFAKLLKHIGL